MSEEIIWINTKIGDQITLQRGFDITKVEQTFGNVPVISSGGISSYHNIEKVKGPGVILGRKGVVGSVFYSDNSYWPHDTTLWVKDFHGNNPKFVYYFFKKIAKSLAHLDVGSANPTLNRNHVHPMEIIWPNLPTQKAIAHILGTLDDKIELNRRINETLESIARAIFKSWFIDFDPVRAKTEGREPEGMDAETAALFPSEFEVVEGQEIPKGWTHKELSNFCTKIENGGTPSRVITDFWEPKELPWLTSGEVRQNVIIKTNNFISKKGFANSSAKAWKPGTTVIALYGATAGQVSLIASDLCSNQACCGLTPKPNFTYYVHLHTIFSIQTLEQLTRGSAQQNISQKIVADLPTLWVNETLIKKFDSIMSPLFSKIISNYREIEALIHIRDTLLPKLLSGELPIPNPEQFTGIS